MAEAIALLVRTLDHCPAAGAAAASDSPLFTSKIPSMEQLYCDLNSKVQLSAMIFVEDVLCELVARGVEMHHKTLKTIMTAKWHAATSCVWLVFACWQRHLLP